MAAIARRLALAALLGTAFLSADDHADVVDRFAKMAAALANENPEEFMAVIDKSMPEYEALKSQIYGMVENANVAADIDPLTDTGDATHRTVELDWFLSLQSRQDAGPTVQRRQVIKCELRKDGKKWKVVAMSPLSFFNAPEFRR